MCPYMDTGSQGVRKSQTLRTDVRTSTVGAVFLEDAQAMVVESQYDDVDRAAHRPTPALEIASELGVLEICTLHDLNVRRSKVLLTSHGAHSAGHRYVL